MLGASKRVASCVVMGDLELRWSKMTERIWSEDQMMRYFGRLRRMDEARLTKKMYEVRVATAEKWKEMKEVLRKYADEEEVDKNTCTR